MGLTQEAIDKTLSPEAWAHFEAAMNALPKVMVAIVRNLEDDEETETKDLIEGFRDEWLKNTTLKDNHPLVDLTSQIAGRTLHLALDEATKWWMAVRMAEQLFEMIDDVIEDVIDD